MLDEKGIKFLPRKTHCYSADDNNIYFTVMYKEAEIGYIALQKCDFKVGIADVAYKIYQQYRKKGLGTLTVKCFLKFCIAHFYIERFTAFTKKTNEGSNKILKANGFESKDGKDILYNYYKYDVFDNSNEYIDYPEFHVEKKD